MHRATVNLIAALMASACAASAYAAPAADKKNPTMSVKVDNGAAKDEAVADQKISPHKAADKKPENTSPKPGLVVSDKQKLDDKQADAAKNRQNQAARVAHAQKKMPELSFDWPIKGRVLKSFSPARNKGIDIAGKKGQPIKATEAGLVVYGRQGLIGFGKLLIILHNHEYLSAYTNAGRLLVREGQHVDKGQLIAEVGDLGIKRTSLHFEIRKNGKPVNPFTVLPKN